MRRLLIKVVFLMCLLLPWTSASTSIEADYGFAEAGMSRRSESGIEWSYPHCQPYSVVRFDYYNVGAIVLDDLLVTRYDCEIELYLCVGIDSNGMPVFSNRTEYAFGGNPPRNMRGCSVADFDNDGHMDLFIAGGYAEQAKLYRNAGDGTFTDVTSLLNLNSADLTNVHAGAWADYDGDGLVDLYLCRGGVDSDRLPDFLLRNDLTGTNGFVNVTADVGMTQDSANVTDAHAAVWQGENESGQRVASGVYLVRFRAGPVVQSQRLLLLK